MIKIYFFSKKIFVLKFYYATIPYFRPLNTFMRKGKDPDPYL